MLRKWRPIIFTLDIVVAMQLLEDEEVQGRAGQGRAGQGRAGQSICFYLIRLIFSSNIRHSLPPL